MNEAGVGQLNLAMRRRLPIVAALLLFGLLATLPLLLLSPRREQLLALNSLYLAAATCLLTLPLGTLLAVLLSRTDVPGRKSTLLLFAAMLFMPLYLQVAAWDAGFGRQGWYSVVLGSVAAPPLERWRGAIWVHTMAALPWVTLIVAAGLRRVDPELEEAALLDASPVQVFRRVTFPQAIDSLGLAALWIMLTTAGEFTVADMYQVNTYARELYFGFALGELSIWPGAAITVWLTIAAALFFARLSKWRQLVSPRPPRRFPLRGARVAGTLVIVLAVMLVAGAPLANLAYQAGIDVQQIGDERLRTWSVVKLATMVTESLGRFQREFAWTFATGALTASLAVLLAAPLAWLARSGGWRAIPALGTAAIGVAVPGPVMAMGLIYLLNREGAPGLVWLYDRTIFAPTVAMLFRTGPWAILICWFAFRSLPPDTLEMAELDGAGPWARLLWVAAPQRWPALALAWLVALVVATGDLAASILVVPPGVDLLSVRIFGLIHAGVDDLVAGVCLAIILGVVALAGLAWILLRRFGASAMLLLDER